MKLLSYLAFFSFVIDAVLAVAALWFDRRNPLNRWCATLAILFALWSFGEIFFYASDDASLIALSYRISALGWAFVPPVLLSFCFAFTGKPQGLRSRVLTAAPFYLSSVVLLVFVLSGGTFLEDFYPTELGNVGLLEDDGPWFWLSVIANYSAFGITTFLLVHAHRRSVSKRYRHQSRILLTVMVIVSTVNILINIVLPPVWRYTAILWAIPVATILYLIVKYRFMRLDYSLVRDEIISAMDEALVLLDAKLRIIDMNPAAKRLFAEKKADSFAGMFDAPEGLHAGWTASLRDRMRVKIENASIREASVLITLSPTFDEFGDPVGGVALITPRNIMDAAALAYGITAREKTVALMLMQGFSNKEIADVLFVSVGTIKTHVHNIYQKTGAGSRVDLVRIFIQNETPAEISSS